MRTRKQLVREQTSHTQRLQKTLEDANIKLDSVISDILGVSGRAMVEALIAGESDPAKLAALAHRRLRVPAAVLREALRGRVTKHHRFLLRLHLRQIDALAALIGDIDREVAALLAPFRAVIKQLMTAPGVSDIAAPSILAEIGPDMSRFPTEGHLLSWAGFCPRNDESAGKRRSSRLKKGAPWLKTTLVQCAWAAVRKKGSYAQAQFRRLLSRHGPKKAICAVAASLLTAIYHMLKNGTVYQDLGADHFDRRAKHTKAARLAKQLANLGYAVQITPLPAAA
jgi:transposase